MPGTGFLVLPWQMPLTFGKYRPNVNDMASQVLHIAIDRFGRVVLPKEIRDHLGLRAGTEFEVEEQEDAILLKPVPHKARIIEEQGLPVLELGEPISRELVQDTIDKVRRGGISR